MNQIAEALRLHAADKVLQSARIVGDVTRSTDAVLSNPHSTPSAQALARAVRARLLSPDVQRIVAEGAEVQRMRESLRSSNGWTLSYDGAATKVWHRREPDAISHSMRIEGEIRAPLMHLAALLYEADLFEHILWFVNMSKILHEPSRLRRAAHFRLYAPWPLYQRDVALYGYAVDALDEEDDCILIMSRSMLPSDGIPIPEEDSANRIVRANVHFAGCELHPRTPTVTGIRCVFNADPKLAYIPPPLINWASRTLCRWALRALESRARNLLPEYEHRMQTKVIYNWFDSRLKEYWTMKGKAADYEAPPLIEFEHRVSGDFDIDATPEAPSRSMLAGLFSRDPSPPESVPSTTSSNESMLSKGRFFASRMFFRSANSRDAKK